MLTRRRFLRTAALSGAAAALPAALPGAIARAAILSGSSGVDRDVDMRKAFPIGSEVEVVVLEVDPAGRRIRLSKKAVAEQREQAELREYAARPDAAPKASLGSLADSLRDAFGKR